MMNYTVKWGFWAGDAGSPEEAADQAVGAMRDPAATLLLFTVECPDGTTALVDVRPGVLDLRQGEQLHDCAGQWTYRGANPGGHQVLRCDRGHTAIAAHTDPQHDCGPGCAQASALDEAHSEAHQEAAGGGVVGRDRAEVAQNLANVALDLASALEDHPAAADEISDLASTIRAMAREVLEPQAAAEAGALGDREAQ
jgi:hypothetical protein